MVLEVLGDRAKLLVVSSRIVAIARRRCFWLLRRDPPVATNNGRQRSIAMHREGEIVYNWLKRGKIYNRVASEGGESIQLLASESEGLS